MIYLIKTEYKEITLLKIGYTGDSNRQTRYTQYRLHNPLFQVLYEIPEATELEEKKLQYYFREHQYGDYGNEWFRYSDDIIDYFKNHTTKESLIDLPDVPGDKRLDLVKFRKEVREAIEYVLSVKVDQGAIQPSNALKQVDSLTDHVIDKRIRTTRSLWKYIKDVFDVLPLKYMELDDDIRDEVFEFMENFQELTRFTDKMRLLCESSLTDEAREIVLSQISIDFKTFYNSLGPERIKANCYKKGELNKELNRRLESTSGGIIGKIILNNFNIGDRISLSDAKLKLKNLYELNGVNSSPKATELLNYFEVKRTRVKSSDGSRFVDGYEILNIKSL